MSTFLQVGFILATKDVKVPEDRALQFQYEPVKTIASRTVSSGFTLEARANVKESCKRNDNRSFICKLVQLASGIKATTDIRIKSNSNAMTLVLEFSPDGQVPDFSIETLSKVATGLFWHFVLFRIEISIQTNGSFFSQLCALALD